MSQVDFYLISNRVKDGKLKMACRLSNKIVRLGEKIFVYTEDDSISRSLDRLMWTYSDTSFIPHEYCQEEDETVSLLPSPVTISHHRPSSRLDATVLISLSPNRPDFCDRFERVVEIVDAEEEDKIAARQRFKAYQDEGLQVNHHRIEL